MPRVSVNDTAQFHLDKQVLAQQRQVLEVDHQFAVAHSPRSNGTCERMVRELIKPLKFIGTSLGLRMDGRRSGGPVGVEYPISCMRWNYAIPRSVHTAERHVRHIPRWSLSPEVSRV